MNHAILRRARLLSWLLGASLFPICAVHAQQTRERNVSSRAQATISRRVRSFYAFYVGQANKDRDALDNRAFIRSYVSRRLVRWLYSRVYGGQGNEPADYNADYFLQAQDFDSDWNQARISDVRIQGNVAHLNATLGHPTLGKGIGQQKLRLTLVKEDGLWKIDSVEAVNH